MGAMPYKHFTTYQPDAAASLLAIQAEVVDANYDVENVVSQQIASVREALANTPDDDEYGVGDQYREELAFLEGLAEKPLPENDGRKISYIRAAFRFDECGLGNILDIRDVTESKSPFCAAPMPRDLIATTLKGERPTRTNCDEVLNAAYAILDRAECFYMHLYSDDTDSPVETVFVGYTVD